ncbi:amino acid ABC transporter [Allostella vacuolata]|nr:amino acid ABC transporter [Stella vacuolata]
MKVLPVILRPAPAPWRAPVLDRRHGLFLALGLVLAVGAAEAQGAAAAHPSVLATLWRWTPLLMEGFVFNIAISLLAMAIGTVMGVLLGLGQVAPSAALRRVAWFLTQFFRNAPWLVLLFFAMFLLPFEVRVGGVTIPLPGWLKATIGFSLPVMANTAEIVRGAIQSIPFGQWEAAESLAFSRRRTLWMIILPQCVKRMLPPWMNLYSLVTMATVLASVVGVTEMLTLVSEVHAAEGGRAELLAPLYGYALICFFLYCYPIGRLTVHLERRFQVRI